MARINNTNKQQTLQNPNPQSVKWPAEWVVAPSLTNADPSQIEKWENFNEWWGANSKLWDAFNKWGDIQWKVGGQLIVEPIRAFAQTQKDTAAGSQYLNQNKQEQTVWGYNYSFNSTPGVWEQGQYNSLVGSGAVAGMPQNNSKLLEEPAKWNVIQTTAKWQVMWSPTRVAIAEQARAMEEWTPEVAATPAATTTVAWWTAKTSWWTTTTTNQRQLKNADVNFSQYGDDSSAPNQATRWGQNEKYTWEFVKNSNLGYDPNIKLADLDPNYLFWMDAQWANSDSAGYIARRNDMIASALYNEGLTSKEDVLNWLSQQPGWMNSTEADRFNTVESIWKRLGSIAEANQPEQLTPEWATYSDDALNAMEWDLNKSTSWMIYGKVTAEEWNPKNWIETLEDENSVYKAMNESRIAAFKQIDAMDSQAIAAAVISNAIAEDSQQMRDLMQYDPAKYEYVMQAIKLMRGQQNINSITNWDTDFSTTIWTNSKSEIERFASDNANSSTSAADILDSVNSTLSSNEAATTAEQTMADIEKDMAKLKNRLKNLRKEANTVFKWDVPQYIVNAYVSNRTAEIQNEMQMLEDRYNAAYSRYQNEWEKVKWEKEYDLKKEELALKKSNATWDMYMDEQWLALKYAEATGDTSALNRNLMRTERNNNPTAMTTDVAKSLWLVEWVDYTIWDPFTSGSGSTLYTAKLLWDPVETTIKALDTAASTGRWAFYTSGWKQRWSHTAMSDQKWLSLSDEEKRNVILNMLQKEWGNINNMAAYWGGSGAWTMGGAFTRNDGTEFDLSSSPTFSKLDTKSQQAVIQLLNNNKNPTSVTKRAGYKDPEWIFAAVNEINPLWSETDFSNRKTAENAWARLEQWWATSRNATAVSTAKRIYDMIDGLTDAELAKTKIKSVNQLINTAAENLWNTKIVELKTLLNWLQSEAAGALKWWNAAISDKDKQDMENVLNVALSKDQLKSAMASMVRLLYDKNETEAAAIYRYGFYKKAPIWTDESADWMYNDLWIDLSVYYNYNPYWGWSVFWQSNNVSSDDMLYNIFSY